MFRDRDVDGVAGCCSAAAGDVFVVFTGAFFAAVALGAGELLTAAADGDFVSLVFSSTGAFLTGDFFSGAAFFSSAFFSTGAATGTGFSGAENEI